MKNILKQYYLVGDITEESVFKPPLYLDPPFLSWLEEQKASRARLQLSRALYRDPKSIPSTSWCSGMNPRGSDPNGILESLKDLILLPVMGQADGIRNYPDREAMQALIRPNRYKWNSMSREERLKEAAMDFIRMCAEQGDGDSPRQMAPQLDPYPRASVASVARPMLPTMIRQGQTESSFQSDNLESSRVSKKPVMKRKVLRRTPDGEVQVTDESITSETESNNPSVQQSSPECENLNQRMYLLNAQEEKEECNEENQPQSCPGSVYSWSPSEDSQNQCSRKESQSLSSSSFEQDFILTGYPKSFILPKLEQLSRNRMKTDRVARYLEHKHDWESLRLPGEDPRKNVRWSIREQMLYKSELPPKAQPVYVPNNYLVPTEKKRSALRWGIRCDLANGVVPRNIYPP